MIKKKPEFPFKIGTTSMVFGGDVLKNMRLLAGLMDHIEIVLFHTPSLNNIPRVQTLRMLKRIGEEEDLSYTVHLPASLEIASSKKGKREESVQLAKQICREMKECDPVHYILHIPFTPPTLVPVPGLYFNQDHQQVWEEWTQRALESLEMLCEGMGWTNRLLVENINYSPSFLEPFWEKGFCELCLDLGHLMLGQEKVTDSIRENLDVTKEIHLHGVRGYEEHLSLSVLPEKRVSKWLEYLVKAPFRGVVILEVFSPRDLRESLDIVLKTPFL